MHNHTDETKHAAPHTHLSHAAPLRRWIFALFLVVVVLAGGFFFLKPEIPSLLLWIQAQQKLFHETLGVRLRAVAATHSVTATLSVMMIGFLYGLFHAAGPGHGKVIVAGYVLAGRHTLRRGLLVAALSSLLQAVTAITLVMVLYKVMGMARQQTEDAAQYLEIAGYGFMAFVGGALFLRGLREIFTAHTAHHHEHHDGCNHTLNPMVIAKTSDIRSLALMIISIGIRPCTGAILLLVFTCIIGAVTAGILATLAMALGTFITTATLAVLAVQSKKGLLKLFGGSEAILSGIHATIGIVGGVMIFTIAGLFLVANLQAKPLEEIHRHPLLSPPRTGAK